MSGKEQVCVLDNHGPSKTIIGNCDTSWPINSDKSWEKEERTKV